MQEPIVRISQGFFSRERLRDVNAALDHGRITLDPAIRALPGLLHYYVASDVESCSMVNVSLWESMEAAQQMSTLAPMLAQRDVFVAMGVEFQPIRNYTGLWSITP
jgi:hypothetical protein